METCFMQAQSFLIVALMAFGLYKRKKRNLHIRIMSAAMIWDIVLILQIELSRSAILKASKVVSNPILLNIHVALALTTVVLYGVMIFSGRKMLAGEMQFRSKHRILGYSTFLLRVMTFVTSFWAVVPKE
ncbi:MAG: hypothetical protein AB7I27_16480 [Bacteriovoracaceae bacterium]